MTLFIATVISALACGFCAGRISRGPKRRHGLDSWNAPRRDPEPTWGKWETDIAKGLRK